jgi:uncharacterized Ntn-hydrolase superfamily protein
MTATSLHPLPDGVPILDAGRHDRPEAGACLMEYVSVLAGERWSDHPWCTQPLLAAVARAVNDRVSGSARAELALFAPDLSGATRRGPVTSAAVFDAVVTASARYVDVPQPTRQLRDRAVARSATPTSQVRRWWRGATACDFSRAADRSLGALVEQVSRSAGDDGLIDLLRSGLDGYGATVHRITSVHLVAAPLTGAAPMTC